MERTQPLEGSVSDGHALSTLQRIREHSGSSWCQRFDTTRAKNETWLSHRHQRQPDARLPALRVNESRFWSRNPR